MKRTHNFRSITVLLLLCLSCLAVLTGCSKEKTTDTIKIGSVHPLTGSMAYEGQALVNAQRCAIDKINSEGGINGRMLELVVRDSMGTSSGSANAALKLTTSGIVALTGTYTSSSAQVVSRTAEKEKIPFVVTVAASDNLLSNGYRYTFRIQPSVSTFSKNFFQYLDFFKDDDTKTVAFLYENSNYGTGIAEYIEEHIQETGLEIVGMLAYPASASTLSSEVTRLASMDPDLLVPIGYYSDQNLFMKEVLERGIEFRKIVGCANGAFSDAKFLKTYGDQVNGLMDINYRYNPNSPLTQEMRDAYRKNYGEEIPVHAIYGYESIMVLADALHRCENVDDPEAVRNAIADSHIEDHVLPQGTIAFDDNGENTNSAGVLVEIINGEHIIVFPEEYADKKKGD